MRIHITQILDKHIKAYLKYEKEIKSKSISYTAVAKLENSDRHILSRINKEGYQKINKHCYYNNDALKIILVAIDDLYKNKLGYKDIYRKYDIKRDTLINAHIKLYSKEPDISHTLIQYNRDSFDSIDTEDKAYWLGFLTADGNVFRNELRLQISARDEEHLHKYIKFLNGDTNMIREDIHSITGNTLVKVNLYDRDIVSKVKEYGLGPNKSCNEVPYYGIDDSLIPHYIRGLIDGDGYIFKNLSGMGLVGSEELLSWVKRNLEEQLSITINSQVRSREGDLFRFEIHAHRNIVCEYLYGNASVYLDRKYKLAMDLLSS